MKILIATGIYPPALGGPAKYAHNLKIQWEIAGHKVDVKTYNFEHKLPSGIRHLYYFFKILPSVFSSDFIFALDTFSVGAPATLAAKLFRKKIIMRTGGDFLWEGYVERTGDLVLLKDFYTTSREKWDTKENLIFRITQWTLRNVSVLAFSTTWQRDIFVKAYDIEGKYVYILENCYSEKSPLARIKEGSEKNYFLGSTRKLKWKNLGVLEDAFGGIIEPELDLKNYPHDEFIQKISECYATILVSLGDISPNMILESIRFNKPFIITAENGLMDRIKDIAITVDPKNPQDIREKVLWLCKKENYDAQLEKIRNFTYTHTWKQIADEIIDLCKKL